MNGRLNCSTQLFRTQPSLSNRASKSAWYLDELLQSHCATKTECHCVIAIVRKRSIVWQSHGIYRKSDGWNRSWQRDALAIPSTSLVKIRAYAMEHWIETHCVPCGIVWTIIYFANQCLFITLVYIYVVHWAMLSFCGMVSIVSIETPWIVTIL